MCWNLIWILLHICLSGECRRIDWWVPVLGDLKGHYACSNIREELCLPSIFCALALFVFWHEGWKLLKAWGIWLSQGSFQFFDFIIGWPTCAVLWLAVVCWFSGSKQSLLAKNSQGQNQNQGSSHDEYLFVPRIKSRLLKQIVVVNAPKINIKRHLYAYLLSSLRIAQTYSKTPI